MERQTMVKVMMIFILGILLVSFTHSPLSAAADQTVVVTMQDDTEQVFEYGSFNLNWEALQVKDELTCKLKSFEATDLTVIYVLSMSWDSCEKKDNQLFDIKLGDRLYQGFCSLKNDSVSGKPADGGEEISIPYSDIKKISFHH